MLSVRRANFLLAFDATPHIENYAFKNSSIVAYVFIAAVTFLHFKFT
jgi:hypothetical protein